MDAHASLESLFTELLPVETEMFSSHGIALASMGDVGGADDIHLSSGSEIEDFLNDEMFCLTDMENREYLSTENRPCPSHCVNQNDNASFGRDSTVILGKERPVKKINCGSPAGSKSSSYVLSFEKPCTPLVTADILLTSERQRVGSALGGNDVAGPGFPSREMNSSSSTSRLFPKHQKSAEASCRMQEVRSPNTVTRGSRRGKDHIVAERLRREKLSVLFISLSALIPGLKKIDKASVLSDAVKYVKQLKERLRLLEEGSKTSTVSSARCIKKTEFTTAAAAVAANEDDSVASCCISTVRNPSMQGRDISGGDPTPEVVVRVSEKDTLVRIHCGKHNRVLGRIFNGIENLHLSVIHTTVLPFGDSRLEVTIVAEMVDAHKMTATDIEKFLRLAISPV